jgi:hypothetical protein
VHLSAKFIFVSSLICATLCRTSTRISVWNEHSGP